MLRRCTTPSPGSWCIDGYRLNLFADRTRHLPASDPDSRDLVLSCGAILHHLAVVAAASGWKTRIRRMPSVVDDDHLATVTFEPHVPTEDEKAMLEAVAARRTDRRRPSSWPVPIERLEPMVDLAASAGVLALPVTAEKGRARLLELTLSALEHQRQDSRYQEELASWVGPLHGGRCALEQPPGALRLPGRRVRRPGPAREISPGSLLESEEEESESGAAFLVLATSSDDRTSQLRAGEALSAVLLRGASSGVSMVPLSAAIEVSETRAMLQEELLDDVAFPQGIIQVGWRPIAQVDLPPTPRRPVDEVLSSTC